ncbi:hypothetical protein [Streptomyces cinereoruber]|uniref:hypothetical protein n=1 Tax=Streptomyces cinereoruber TaxID=67260 RepID=UPI003637264C
MSRVSNSDHAAPAQQADTPGRRARKIAEQRRATSTRTASTCPACGETLTHTPGKVAKTYCSATCRQRAKRTAGKGSAGPQPVTLGSKGRKFPDPEPVRTAATAGLSDDVAEAMASELGKVSERTRRNWVSLYRQWSRSGLKSVRGCRRGARDQGAGVTYVHTGDHTATKGVTRCASVWACPVCEGVIRRGRADDVDKALVEHIRRGGTAYFVTLTSRHWANHDLADLLTAQLTTVFKGRLISGRRWARSTEGGLRDRLGVVGTIRVVEVTVGPWNGWHPHIHLVILMGGRQDPKPPRGSGVKWDPTVRSYFKPKRKDLTELRRQWTNDWISGLTAVNPDFKPSRTRGVDFKLIEAVPEAEKVAKYVTKLQGSDSGAWSVGMEMSQADLKASRGENLKPMDLLHRLTRLEGGEVPEDVPGWGSRVQLSALWMEYELATRGRQNMAWSEGLKRAYGITSDEDQDAADRGAVDMEDEAGGDRYVHVPAKVKRDIAARRVELEARAAAAGGAEVLRAFLGSVGVGFAGVRDLTADEDAEKWAAVKKRDEVKRPDRASSRARNAERLEGEHRAALETAATTRREVMTRWNWTA